MTASVTALSSRNFDEEVVSSDVPVLVEVGAEWCPSCRAMQPVLKTLAHQYDTQLKVFTVDSDADPAVVARFGVAGVPTLLVFQEGRLVKRLVGARSKRRLVDDLGDLLR